MGRLSRLTLSVIAVVGLSLAGCHKNSWRRRDGG